MKKIPKPTKDKMSFETELFSGHMAWGQMELLYNPLPEGNDWTLNERLNDFRNKEVRITIEEL